MALARRIVSPEDLTQWIESPAYNEIITFITKLQDLVQGKPNDSPVQISENSQNILSLLDNGVQKAIDNNPVVHEKEISRFGKIEFRDFYDELGELLPTEIKTLVVAKYGTEEEANEISEYLKNSFGNRTRIDYGSGHELNFIVFLLCLHKLKYFQEEDFPCIILQVFNKYMKIMRQLQKVYWLEPAGSHGVWGLDDYHFLPFLFGASQLATHPHMRPKLIHNEELVEQFYKQYMYLECIHFINSIKTMPQGEDPEAGNGKLSLRWHSPMLDDILAAKSWAKIKEGMIKMYKAEVLSKLPIIQHLMFGTLIVCPEGVAEHSHDDADSDCGHIHEAANTWGDCCGIKVPSAIAASEMNKLKKPIPFD